MNYHKIETCNLSNGTGFRVVLWVSGCNHHCSGCHNPETWDPNGGKPFTEKQEKQIIKYLKPNYIQGLTISGGDPLMPCNRETVLNLCKRVKDFYPNKDIWIYTGYTYEELCDQNMDMNNINVIVDGPYIEAQRDISLAFRGSTNQNICYIL